MADYISLRKGRNIASTILHVILNILLGVGSIVVAVITGSWVVGAILVLISKWRVFAVRPRFWFLNLKSGIVDFIVGFSFVIIAYEAGTTFLPVHGILAVAYTLWLIALKPRSSELATEIQALIAVFLGTSAATLALSPFDSIWLVIASFVIGFGASRHILVQNNDRNPISLTLVCGLAMAEFALISDSWLIVYSFGSTGIIIPQVSIILTTLAFLMIRTYHAIAKRDGQLRVSDIAAPLTFSVILIFIIIFVFSNPIFNI